MSNAGRSPLVPSICTYIQRLCDNSIIWKLSQLTSIDGRGISYYPRIFYQLLFHPRLNTVYNVPLSICLEFHISILSNEASNSQARLERHNSWYMHNLLSSLLATVQTKVERGLPFHHYHGLLLIMIDIRILLN